MQISQKTSRIPENVFCISYRFYENQPAIRKEGEIAVPEKPKKDKFESDRKVPYVERLAKRIIKAAPKRGIERYVSIVIFDSTMQFVGTTFFLE